MLSPEEALARLREGNKRFAAGESSFAEHLTQARREAVLKNQEPFAIVLGCSDSRVPASIVFDQGLGDLFAIRVAGNIVSPSQIGSVEFAAARFGTRLAVVLGHSSCGVVTAALQEARAPEPQTKSLLSIVRRVRPSVASALEASPDAPFEAILARAVRLNIRASVNMLRNASALLEGLIENGRLAVVGAEYSLDSGLVDFFEGAGA
jgi:carbonic anhydrase